MLSRRQTLGLVALTLMWGINWPFMKLSLQELSPLYFRALTMTGGAIWLFAFYRQRGVRLTPQANEWHSIVTLGLPNMLGWHTLAIFGVAALASGRASILGFTMPVWTVLLGALFFGQKLTPRSTLGAVLVAGAVALLLADELGAMAGRPVGVLVMLGAAICWAVGTLMMRRATLTLPMEALTVWMMSLTAVALWVMAWAFEPWPQWQFSLRMWGLLAYGMFINYGVAQIIWFSLARHLPPATSAMSVMMVPLVGTASATFIAGEWPRWTDGVAVVCVMAAIATVLLPASAVGRRQ